jgi:hypothetical protein
MFFCFFQGVTGFTLQRCLAPIFFDRLRLQHIQTWSVLREQNLILKQAFHSILVRQLCQSTGCYEIRFSSIVEE